MRRFLFCLLLLFSSLSPAAEPARQITVGMTFDSAAALLRAAGAREGRFFDEFHPNPPPKWMNFALPDLRTVTLYAKPSELFPNVFRITGIFVTYPGEADLGGCNLKGDRKSEQVTTFDVPEPGSLPAFRRR